MKVANVFIFLSVSVLHFGYPDVSVPTTLEPTTPAPVSEEVPQALDSMMALLCVKYPNWRFCPSSILTSCSEPQVPTICNMAMVVPTGNVSKDAIRNRRGAKGFYFPNENCHWNFETGYNRDICFTFTEGFTLYWEIY